MDAILLVLWSKGPQTPGALADVTIKDRTTVTRLIDASRSERPGHKYLVCNADEMEPGTFKDRYLLEHDPHLLVEGMIIGAFAIQADKAYVFMRGEYHDGYRQLARAIEDAGQRGYLGEGIFGTSFNLELSIHRSGGRYICGEETALLNALEGKRAQPRYKPPFPPASGAWGRPTIVNNVETLCNVPGILRHGAQWFQDLGQGDDAGTKLYGVSGRVNNPGLWELPIGTTIREIIEEHAGGMQPGYQLKGILPGGASTDFLVDEHLDLPMDYGSIQAAGSRMCTGTMITIAVEPERAYRIIDALGAQKLSAWVTLAASTELQPDASSIGASSTTSAATMFRPARSFTSLAKAWKSMPNHMDSVGFMPVLKATSCPLRQAKMSRYP